MTATRLAICIFIQPALMGPVLSSIRALVRTGRRGIRAGTHGMGASGGTTDYGLQTGEGRATDSEGREESLREYCERTGSDDRQLAKARVLGLGFGCAARGGGRVLRDGGAECHPARGD